MKQNTNHKKAEKGSKPHITEKQLEKELQKGKTQKQIAYEYGYGHPSRRLTEKIRELGFEKKPAIDKEHPDLYMPPKLVKRMVEKAGFSFEEELYFDFEELESGGVRIKPVKQKWGRE